MIYKYDFTDYLVDDFSYQKEFNRIKKHAIIQMLDELPLEVLEKIVPISDVKTIMGFNGSIFQYTLELDTEKKMFNIAEYYSDLVREEIVYNEKDFV